jgi:hypothetical protein
VVNINPFHTVEEVAASHKRGKSQVMGDFRQLVVGDIFHDVGCVGRGEKELAFCQNIAFLCDDMVEGIPSLNIASKADKAHIFFLDEELEAIRKMVNGAVDEGILRKD